MTESQELFRHEATSSPGKASLIVDADVRSAHTVNPLLYGKFCEHLGRNIYHGMEAQILFNCTFASWRFGAGDGHPDGGVQTESDRERISERIRGHAQRESWPDADQVINAYFSGGAYGWVPVGASDNVTLSPDVGPYGGRAQRVEITVGAPGAGIGQWTYLPRHRTRVYEFRFVARAVEPCTVTLHLAAVDEGRDAEPRSGASAAVMVADAWQTITGTLTLGADAPADGLYQFTVTTEATADLVIDRVLLYPDDHINGADPDVIRLLKEAHLPLLRWPGGNFVSGYHWQNGVGPVDARPSLPNPAWEGVEFNLFGTDEFIAFCHAVGCEPMICVNAGNGTAEEAAAWVQYCNGGPETPMGALRAANGHPEPYGVRLWEIGNEIYGRWQVGWTTPGGNADRYRRFREAMLSADPTIELLGCGHGNEPGSEWNERLIEEAGTALQTITDHILTGGTVTVETDPVELYHAFMGYPEVLTSRYTDLRDRMSAAGIQEPHLGITELQLFAHFQGEPAAGEGLTPETVPTPDTIAEALSLALIQNMCIRLGDFVALLTHSATVNHGGGLRKVRERVYANPVHYAHAMGHALANGIPVAVNLTCGTFGTTHAFAHIPPLQDIPVLDATAVLAEDGNLVLTLVHRGGDTGEINLSITLAGFEAQRNVEVTTLAGSTWYERNTPSMPKRIAPQEQSITLNETSKLDLTIHPFSLTQIALRRA